MIISLISNWLYWHFIEFPIEILKGTWNFIVFFLNYFSISKLIRTFFSPWKKAEWDKPKGFNPGLLFKIGFSNMISRVIGAFLRSFVIISGFVLVIITLIIGATVFIFWIISPALIVLGLIKSFEIMF
jgi:hypothetical protein